MKTLRIRQTRRLSSGHLWVFANELADKPAGIEPGEIVELVDLRGEFLAVAYANPHSLIVARVLSRKRVAIDEAFLRQRIAAALAYRDSMIGKPDACRLVFGEADGLPGLVVDRYADTLVLQSTTAGMDRLLDPVLAAVDELLQPRNIVLRNDSSIRKLEGLATEKRSIKGEPEPLPVIREGDANFEVDCWNGQKTGFFLDQRENRLAFAELVQGGEGLDLCSYAGAWGLQLAARGARVTCVDSADSAITRVERNRGLNQLAGEVQVERAELFAFLEAAQAAQRRFDFVVLDPPAFAKSKGHLRNALKAYQQANTAALSLLNPGGLLATSSCSYHISAEEFLALLQQSARALGGGIRLIEYRSQGRDHPALLAMPETRYLKCALLQKI